MSETSGLKRNTKHKASALCFTKTLSWWQSYELSSRLRRGEEGISYVQKAYVRSPISEKQSIR
jgi:hypothetical protein